MQRLTSHGHLPHIRQLSATYANATTTMGQSVYVLLSRARSACLKYTALCCASLPSKHQTEDGNDVLLHSHCMQRILHFGAPPSLLPGK
jgi:hypothetical protein